MEEKKRIKINVNENGRVVPREGIEIGILKQNEPWSEYELEDGNKLRIKQIVLKVIKLDTKDALGNPIYITKGQNIVDIDK
jgi:hypothetical protein